MMEETKISRYFSKNNDLQTFRQLCYDASCNRKKIFKHDGIDSGFQNIRIFFVYAKIHESDMLNLIDDLIDFEGVTYDIENAILLGLAITHGDVRIVDAFLRKQFDLNLIALGVKHIDMLSVAYIENRDMFIYLIENGMDINRSTVIDYASCDKNNPDLSYILGLELSETNMLQLFIKCCRYKRFNIANKVITMGLDIAKHSKYLYLEAATMDLESVQYLVKSGLILDSSDPLYFACRAKNSVVVDFYLESGIVPNEEIIYEVLGASPDATFSSKIVDYDTLKVFIKHSVDMSMIKSNNDETRNIIADLKNKCNLDPLILVEILSNIDNRNYYKNKEHNILFYRRGVFEMDITSHSKKCSMENPSIDYQYIAESDNRASNISARFAGTSLGFDGDYVFIEQLN